MADYDYDEIAESLGIRVTTVYNRLYRYRKDTILPKLLRGELHAPTGHVLQQITERMEAA
ncbi:sigma factor-like helix-turn-helix DNA-binding protein [Amycolatopsis lurida]